MSGRILAFAAAAALGFGATAAKADLAKWDQKRVASIAQQLAAAVGDLRETVRKQPEMPNAPKRKVRYQALDDLRTLKQVCDNLARDLRAGKNREQSEPTYQRIQTIRRDLEENGRRADIKLDTLNSYAKVADLNRQLRPYYEEEAKAGEGSSAPSAAPATTPAPAPSTPAQ
ncbi:MAG TPA: hypothetical protein DEP35_15165 [Deltaproteobacteria bacterium]|jgi:hypothetical protein|nr:hypothetical protein [Deltaproteobacteria bacterium]